MKRTHYIIIALIIVLTLLAVGGTWYVTAARRNGNAVVPGAETALAAKFAVLSHNGNSSCSGAFTDAIDRIAAGGRIQGSCCSPMDFHRYSEQVEGLKTYTDIPEIPPDPYDIDAERAKVLKAGFDITLTAKEQEAYDYAMAHSDEKGPCCCKCWRWYVYGGLGKILIREYGFTGERLTEVWNLSDGCGGSGEHAGHA